ncbi:hypothetical protein B0H63DRAFT_385281 [Podospora didyma]|uniref:F-box domain-containing protein n=1 Tax=Podospora didyma TaxID=330526 RepID=A0AAE0P6N4_9PEZI|nr:hypothetical protein B0H63DRAFT_385281 [Podospora didyma]
MRDITELPNDLFLLVVSFLSPRVCVLCRSVSRDWFAAFTSEATSRLLLRWNFPRCREIRLSALALSLTSSSVAISENARAELACLIAQLEKDAGFWAATFASVARRYYHLRRGRPHIVQKLGLAGSSPEKASGFSFRGVATWNRFLRLDEKTANFHYPDPVWWYSQEDGVLVYPAAEPQPAEQCDGYVYQACDLVTGQKARVPFDVRQKYIRRVRLAQGVLVFEWAESRPYHQLNDREVVHRHFVTAFDVVRRTAFPTTAKGSPNAPQWTWTVEFRSEWKLHFLGLPLNRSDRFFSAHTATHYAVYFWQPNRSLYQDDPIEQIAVWDISSPSSYKPSEDPKGDKRPASGRVPHMHTGLWNGNVTPPSREIITTPGDTSSQTYDSTSLASATAGPQVIRRMAWRELDFYGIRQRATPQLRNLVLDDRNLYVIEEEHRWADGQHSWLSPPRVHLVRCTGIPVVPKPPSSTELSAISAIIDGSVSGPVWVDTCGADGDVNMSFCRRIAIVAAEETNSEPAQTSGSWPLHSIGALNIASPEHLEAQLRRPGAGGSSVPAWPWTLLGGADSHTGRTVMEQPSRWPGLAPCWRHEDFPYLTITEMIDVAAGVRVTARHCFMLETLSVHVRPAISVKGTPLQGPAAAGEVEDDYDPDSSNSTSAKKKKKNSKTLPGRCEEVQFPDEMWSELLARGHIAGDERWIIGEDERGQVTIVHF